MNTLTICRKELLSYFRSPIAYGVMAFFALISGYFFYVAVVYFMQISLQSQMSGQSQPMSVNEMVIRPLFSNIAVIGLFIIPMITMRLFAEEKRTGTYELLATSPIRDWEIIMGKWLAALILYASILAISLISVLTLFGYGKPDWRPLMVGYLGLLLQGGCLLAIGTFISTCTKNQIVAGMVTFAVLLLLWTVSWMQESAGPIGQKVLQALSLTDRFDDFTKGVIDLKHVVYYLSFISFGLFLTAKSVDSERWRG